MQPRLRATLAVALVIAPLGILAAACSSAPPEQQLLNQFFRASRTRDNETLARMSAVELDPREHGEVTDFEIVSVGEERRTPLDFKGLLAAQQKAIDDEADFRRRRVEFESANRPALEAIAKMERDATAKFNATQQKLKEEWDKWRQDALAVNKATSAARAAVANASGPAEASLSQPGQPAFAADKFAGDLVSKDVTVDAEIRKDGQTTNKQLVITIQRVEGEQDGNKRSGRPIIARIQGLS
jgi:hypothetical protein